MKESLQTDESTSTTDRRIIDDVDAMRALAHPGRLAILHFLLSAKARTATECAAEIGATPSACSYHLRELERFGLVERAEPSGDGRARPWKAAAIGFSVGRDWSNDSTAALAAGHAIRNAGLAENSRLIHRFVEAVDGLDPRWQSASDFHNFELLVTPTELEDLNSQVAAVLSHYRAPIRADAPDDAAPVHVVYQAFLRLDV